MAKGRPPTRTRETPPSIVTGSLDSTKPTEEIWQFSEVTKIEEEAKEFTAKKRYKGPPKPLTSRIYLMGMAMNALLSRGSGPVRREEVKREAEEWADFMLDD